MQKISSWKFAAVSLFLPVAFFSFSFNHNSQKKTLPSLHSYVILSPFCSPNTSWKYVGLSVKHPGEMSFKYRRSVGSALYQKMRTPKINVILKKIITSEMITRKLQQNRLVWLTLMSV